MQQHPCEWNASYESLLSFQVFLHTVYTPSQLYCCVKDVVIIKHKLEKDCLLQMTSTNLSGTSPATLVFTNSSPGNLSLNSAQHLGSWVSTSLLDFLEYNSKVHIHPVQPRISWVVLETLELSLNCLCCSVKLNVCLVIFPFVPK